MARANKKPLVSMLVIAVIVAFGLCEIALRWFVPTPLPLGQLSYQTLGGERVADQLAAAQRGFVVPVETAKTPRARHQFAPGKSFYLCYSDVEKLKAKGDHAWLDAQGRVLVRINQYGLREREEIGPDKPAGHKRIVCIGDSFTFGWGIPEEKGWVRRLEDELVKTDSNIRTVNCGAAGAICVDEYWWGLRSRFHAFQPDAVVVTICLNDLIPSSGLFVQGPTPDTGSRVLDLVLRSFGRSPLDLDPAMDWVGLLKDLPRQAEKTPGCTASTSRTRRCGRSASRSTR